MIRLAANLTMLYNELDFLDRFAAAASSGFEGVEYLFPYAYPKEQIFERLQKYHLKQVLYNLPAGDWAKGERGIACIPTRIGEFQEGVEKAIEYAHVLGCTQVNCLAGIMPAGVDPESARKTLVSNLHFAASKLDAAGIKLLIEPINIFDIPGFSLSTTGQALEIIREVDSNNLYLQYDIYHMQRMEGELANTIKTNIKRIAHIQLADNPGRNEPGTGEINYRFLFSFIDSLGYDGWIGCEYKPKSNTMVGLDWRATHGV
jgi:hydroxypyruvate isomerase